MRHFHQLSAPKTKSCVRSTIFAVHPLLFHYVCVGSGALWPMSQWFWVNSWRTSHMQLNCCTCLMYRIIHYSIIVLLHSDSYLKSTKRKNDDIGQVRIHTKFEEISSIISRSASLGAPFFDSYDQQIKVCDLKRKRERETSASSFLSLVLGWEISLN